MTLVIGGVIGEYFTFWLSGFLLVAASPCYEVKGLKIGSWTRNNDERARWSVACDPVVFKEPVCGCNGYEAY